VSHAAAAAGQLADAAPEGDQREQGRDREYRLGPVFPERGSTAMARSVPTLIDEEDSAR
jgi:hypothetical protein